MPSPREVLQTFSSIVVTGGSSGIGKSFIELCGNLHPGLWFCNLSRTAPVIKNGKLKLCHIGCDLSLPADVERGAREVEAFLIREAPAGRVLLINNSGFGSYGRFPEPNLSHQLGMIDVNVRAVVDLTARLLPVLKTRGGVIVNIASTAAFQPTPQMATYGATKAFILHWSLALNEDLRGTGVRSLVVCPGPTSTEFFRRAGLQQGNGDNRLSMSVDDVVGQALLALAARRSLVVTGWKNRVSAFLGGLAPKTWSAHIAARVIERYLVSRGAR